MIKLNGDVASQSEVNIYPETSGKVVRVLKNLGDQVSRGQVIAYIDPSRPGAAYAQNPVLSAVSGTITSLPVRTGETVSTSTSIATVGSLNNLKVTIFVAEKYSAYLKTGLTAFLTFASAPDERFEASVSTVSPVVNNKNRTIEATLTLHERDARIKQGMFAGVQLVIQEKNDTLVIPKTAVKNYNGESTVYVIDANNMARRVPVTLGLSNDSQVEITGGLESGDQVIIAGAVTDGSAVNRSDSAL
jgi:RND family efflux transporter MFP subunit